MTTGQMIIIIILCIVYFGSAFLIVTTKDKETKIILWFLNILSFFVCFSLLYFETLEYNKLKSKTKCPEYEIIDNVYILKK